MADRRRRYEQFGSSLRAIYGPQIDAGLDMGEWEAARGHHALAAGAARLAGQLLGLRA